MFVHQKDHENEAKLNVHEIVDHPDHFQNPAELGDLEADFAELISSDSDQENKEQTADLGMTKNVTVTKVNSAAIDPDIPNKPPGIEKFAKGDSLSNPINLKANKIGGM